MTLEQLKRRTVACCTALHVATVPAMALAAQQPMDAAAEAAAFRAVAHSVPLGTRVKLSTRGGARLTAILLSVSEETMVIARETGAPGPVLTIRYDDLSRLQRDERHGGGFVKALGVGLAAGAGAMLTLVGFALSIDD